MQETPKMFTVPIESGVVAVGDPSLQPADLDHEKLVTYMKDGIVAYCSTGGDGFFGGMISVVENFSLDQILDKFEVVDSLSKNLFIKIESGLVGIADMFELADLNANSEQNIIHVEPGIYECQIHVCESEELDFYGFVAWLKKVDQVEARNDSVYEVESLE